jgi:digeranylgeranylglycerophospholipid reductase
MFDIVVIGGNIAGVSAALQAAKKGVNVALIEKHKKPFSPPHCGEAIADVTYDSLKLDEINCKKNEINKIIVNVSSPLKKYIFNLSKNKVFIIDRFLLESELLKKAEKNNIKLFIGRRMTKFNPPKEIILDNNKKVNGKLIIDASGIKCFVGKEIGLNTKLNPKDIGVCIQSRVEGSFDAHTMYMWFHEPYAPFGYAWLFPINEKKANVGLGVIGGQKLDFDKLLKDYLRYMIKENYKVTHTFRACEPMALPLEELVKDNVLFTGDAARLVDPASGAGIHNAIFSGKLAGKIAASYINGEISSINIYQNLLKNKINRISKTYHRKSKLNTSEKYAKGFNRAFSTLELINNIFPNFFQGRVGKIFKKDIKILNIIN